jgi:hypothetical protein
MKSLTNILIGSDFESGLKAGVSADKAQLQGAKHLWHQIRQRFNMLGAPPLLTPPDHNAKLDKAVVPAYGLTLQHYVQKLTTGLTINACPSAGDCTKVCVLDNGMGLYPTVQIARRARTEFFVEEPEAAGILVGNELMKAAIKYGSILFRPNVNSDVEWHKVAPSLTDGTLFGGAVRSYGYSKLPSTLTEKVNTDFYTVAYSANEKSDWKSIDKFLAKGGNVAVVTSRKPHSPVTQWYGKIKVVDADKTDEWMLGGIGLIGDLSAKGKARALVGKSGFVKVLE